jgi:hypothetical protein
MGHVNRKKLIAILIVIFSLLQSAFVMQSPDNVKLPFFTQNTKFAVAYTPTLWGPVSVSSISTSSTSLTASNYWVYESFTAAWTKNVTAIDIWWRVVSASPTYKICITATVGGQCIGGSTNYVTSTPSAAGSSGMLALPTPVSLVAGTTYYLTINYSSGTIGTSNYAAPGYLSSNLKVYTYSNLPATYSYVACTPSCTNKGGSPSFVLQFSDGTYDGVAYTGTSTKNVYGTTTYGTYINGEGFIFTDVRLLMKEGSTAPSANATLTIYDATASTTLFSTTLNNKTMSTSFTWQNISVGTITFQASHTYYIYLSCSSCSSATTGYNVVQLNDASTSDSGWFGGDFQGSSVELSTGAAPGSAQKGADLVFLLNQTADTIPPTVSFNNIMNKSIITQYFILAISASDNVQLQHVELDVNSVAVISANPSASSSYSATYNFGPPPGSPSLLNVTLWAQDTSGNIAKKTYFLTFENAGNNTIFTSWNSTSGTFWIQTSNYKVYVNGKMWRDTEYQLPNSSTTWKRYTSTTNAFETQFSNVAGSGTNLGFYNYGSNSYNNSWPITVSVLVNTTAFVEVQMKLSAILLCASDSCPSVPQVAFNYTQTWYYFQSYYAVQKKWYLYNNATSPVGTTYLQYMIEGSGNNPAVMFDQLGPSTTNDWFVGAWGNGTVFCDVKGTSGEGHCPASSATISPYPSNLPYSVTAFSNQSGYNTEVAMVVLDYSLRTSPSNDPFGITVYSQSTSRGEINVPWIAWGNGYVAADGLPEYVGHIYAITFGTGGGAVSASTAIGAAMPVTQDFGHPASVTMITGTYSGWLYPQGKSSYNSSTPLLGMYSFNPTANNVTFNFVNTAYNQYLNYFLVRGVTSTSGWHFYVNGTDMTSSAIMTIIPQGMLVYYPASWSAGKTQTIMIASAKTSTTTSVSCNPTTIAVGSSTACTATVTGSSPTGSVSWSGSGLSFNPTSCTLSSGSCSTTATATAVGSLTITATYSGDANNAGSSGTTTITIDPVNAGTQGNACLVNQQIGSSISSDLLLLVVLPLVLAAGAIIFFLQRFGQVGTGSVAPIIIIIAVSILLVIGFILLASVSNTLSTVLGC